MKRTVEYLNDLPAWRADEELPKPWLEFCEDAFEVAYADLRTLLALANQDANAKLLPHIQVDEAFWSRPSRSLGAIRILPDEAYRRRTKQTSYLELLELSTSGTPVAGMEIDVDLH